VTALETGEPTPSDPDGTASFVRRGGNGSVLINNHEVSGSEPFPVPRVPGYVYDDAAAGGTTNIEVDRQRPTRTPIPTGPTTSRSRPTAA
jgi:hypothetical protein